MIIGEHNGFKYTFVGSPKAGCHSVNSVLVKHFGGKHVTHRLLGRDSGAVSPFHVQTIPRQFADHAHFVFVSVRNPLPRAVSIWWHVKTTEPAKSLVTWHSGDEFGAFARFLDRFQELRDPSACFCWEVLMPQWSWLRLLPMNPTVLRLETLEHDFNTLPFVDRKIEMPKKNVRASKRPRPWYEYYGDNAYEAVLRWAKDDFDHFEYSRTLPGRA